MLQCIRAVDAAVQLPLRQTLPLLGCKQLLVQHKSSARQHHLLLNSHSLPAKYNQRAHLLKLRTAIASSFPEISKNHCPYCLRKNNCGNIKSSMNHDAFALKSHKPLNIQWERFPYIEPNSSHDDPNCSEEYICVTAENNNPKFLSLIQNNYLHSSTVKSRNTLDNCAKVSDVRLYKKGYNYKLCDNRHGSSINLCNSSSFHSSTSCAASSSPHGIPKPIANNTDYDTELTLPQRLVQSCPAAMQPYLHLLRIDRPIGTWLLFWPCGWGLALAAAPGHWPDPWLMAVFATGAVVMRGAGCTINDLWDRKIDAKVARTLDRPLASGAVGPLDAVVFLGGQLGLGLLVLLELNTNAVLLGAASLGLVGVYPLVKRVSYWPQLVLGLTFNWGVLLGWCAVHGNVALLPVLPLYAAGVSWTLIYDTIYAHQDKANDLQIGVKSTALRFGENTGLWLSGFSAVMVSCLLLTGYTAHLAWPYYTAVTATAANLVYQIRSLNIHDRAHCGRQFRSNRHLGLLVFAGLVSGSLLAESDDTTQPPLVRKEVGPTGTLCSSPVAAAHL